MHDLISKYEDKLFRHGLVSKRPLIGGLNDAVYWNRDDVSRDVFEKVMVKLGVNSILFAKPAEPFNEIINIVCADADFIKPEDTETRTFLHEIPVLERIDENSLIYVLSGRKGAVIKNQGIVTFGSVSPEQAFVFFSSIIFSIFVKYFTDLLYSSHNETLSVEKRKEAKILYEKYKSILPSGDMPVFDYIGLEKPESIIDAMTAAGRKTVEFKLVDSFFGNISFKSGKTIFISQTGSSLDELEGCIDPCPVDGSLTAGITASSELIAHSGIYERTKNTAVLHGHPRFSVIMSLFCEKSGCENLGKCFYKCSEERFLGGFPIIPGEVGAGERGISNTLPPAVVGGEGAVVYGHGVFVVSENGFDEAFKRLYGIEHLAMKKFESKLFENY